jgi:hypothetical protein
MKNEDPIVVYWAPRYTAGAGEKENINWNLLYSDPVQLYKDLSSKRDLSTNARDNILSCPAASSRFRNTYVFKNTLKTHYSFKNNEPTPQNENHILMSIIRPPSLKDNMMVKFHMSWMLFTEEEELMTHINPPYFSNAKHNKYGAVVSGGFDIGKWFRPIATEFNLWTNIKEFSIEDEEPILYVEFLSDRPVILKRFYMSPELHSFAESNLYSVGLMGEWLPLKKRYEQFKRSRGKEIILKEIKKNLL